MMNLQMQYPAIRQTTGAIQEIELPFRFGCTDVELLAAGAAVGFVVPAMIVVFSVF
ncbi:MAG TPA: hypothetical protein VN616_14970 [Puia sp.]|nr:hypothetical protein [Puia sp.]